MGAVRISWQQQPPKPHVQAQVQTTLLQAMADSDDERGDWAECECLTAAQEPVFGASTLCSTGSRPDEAMAVRDGQGQAVQAAQRRLRQALELNRPACV